MRNWNLTIPCWQQSLDQGGYDLGTVGDYLLWTHSLAHVKMLVKGPQHPKSLAFFGDFQGWVSVRASLALSSTTSRHGIKLTSEGRLALHA